MTDNWEEKIKDALPKANDGYCYNEAVFEKLKTIIQSLLDKKEEKVFNDIGSDVCGTKDMFEEVMRLENNIKSEYWIGVYHVLKIFKQKYIKGESNGKDS